MCAANFCARGSVCAFELVAVVLALNSGGSDKNAGASSECYDSSQDEELILREFVDRRLAILTCSSYYICVATFANEAHTRSLSQPDWRNCRIVAL